MLDPDKVDMAAMTSISFYAEGENGAGTGSDERYGRGGGCGIDFCPEGGGGGFHLEMVFALEAVWLTGCSGAHDGCSRAEYCPVDVLRMNTCEMIWGPSRRTTSRRIFGSIRMGSTGRDCSATHSFSARL